MLAWRQAIEWLKFHKEKDWNEAVKKMERIKEQAAKVKEARAREAAARKQDQKELVALQKVWFEEELARRAKRAGRFAADAAKAPPPIPKRTFAHPGGKITSNKEEATATFLRRKEAQSQAPAAAQRPASSARRAAEGKKKVGGGDCARRRTNGVKDRAATF